jgi:hypothetical protein
MSAAAKKKVGERMKAYWAKRRAAAASANGGAAEARTTKAEGEAEKPERPKAKRGTLSAAGRAAISAAQKKRWRARKRGKKR